LRSATGLRGGELEELYLERLLVEDKTGLDMPGWSLNKPKFG